MAAPVIFPDVSGRTPEPLFSPTSAKDPATFPYACDRTTSVSGHVEVMLGPSKSSKKSQFFPKTVTGPAIFPYVSDRTPEPLFSPMSAKDPATFPYVCDRTTSVSEHVGVTLGFSKSSKKRQFFPEDSDRPGDFPLCQ